MASNTIIKALAKQLSEKEFDYEYIGIRVQEERTNGIGDIMDHKSYIWTDGEMTDEQLNGVSAIDIKKANCLSEFGGYYGRYMYVIGCDYADDGEDAGEIIMESPIVLDIIMEGK